MQLQRRERSKARGLAAMAGGLAVGMMTSRLLPPLLASAAGSMQVRLGRDPFQRLVRDHRQIQSLVDRMVGASEDSVARRTALFLSLKRALGKHALAEEDVVYPLLHGAAAGAAKQLYGEHADMKIHLFELEMALKRDAGWTGRVQALQELIGRHIREEEEVQFPKLQATMDQQQRRSLSAQIHREEALLA
jgi:iron-sulfur cluster repair protein YtfE (RIC family)